MITIGIYFELSSPPKNVVAFLISSRIAFVSNRRIRILLDERKQASWFLAPKIEEDSQRKSDFIFHLANHSTFLHVSLGVISLCGPWGGMHLEIGSLLSLINTIVISTVLLASLAFYCKDEVMIPIHIACGGNLKDEVADFLQYFFPDGVEPDRIKFLLHDAIRNSYVDETDIIEAIKSLVEILPEGILHVADDKGLIPFQIACQFSSIEMVECFLEIMDADMLSVHGKNGDTVMHYACSGGNLDLVDHILDYHMQLVTKRNVKGELPLHLLCNCKETWFNQSDKSHLDHLELVWRLLLAYPEAVCC